MPGHSPAVLAAPARGGHPITSRRTISRSTTTFWTPASWSTPSRLASVDSANRAACDATLPWPGAARTHIPAVEMTKWFDTNYHYLVPEFEPGQAFRLASTKPWTSTWRPRRSASRRGRSCWGPSRSCSWANRLPRARIRWFTSIRCCRFMGSSWSDWPSRGRAGSRWTSLAWRPTRPHEHRAAWASAYERLSDASGPRLLVATYFGDLGDNLQTALRLPVDALHVDLVRWRDHLDRLLASVPERLSFSLGLVDGRNVWKTDLDRRAGRCPAGRRRLGTGPGDGRALVLAVARAGRSRRGNRTGRRSSAAGWLSDGRSWQRFACWRGRSTAATRRAARNWRPTPRRREPPPFAADAQPRRPAAHGLGRAGDARRKSPFAERRRSQQRELVAAAAADDDDRLLSTDAPRSAKPGRAISRGELSDEQYDAFRERRWPRRFASRNSSGWTCSCMARPNATTWSSISASGWTGFAFTENGWVQSYGSRCVKPPILFGDVRGHGPMTVGWATSRMACTAKPVKGMLTGPVTILCWSFVRDDQPRSETCRQIALAIRDEVPDLEAAGVGVIQIDEPALREGMPLRRADRPSTWTGPSTAFRLASCGVARRDPNPHAHVLLASSTTSSRPSPDSTPT